MIQYNRDIKFSGKLAMKVKLGVLFGFFLNPSENPSRDGDSPANKNSFCTVPAGKEKYSLSESYLFTALARSAGCEQLIVFCEEKDVTRHTY